MLGASKCYAKISKIILFQTFIIWENHFYIEKLTKVIIFRIYMIHYSFAIL